jgi:hypothetical protein
VVQIFAVGYVLPEDETAFPAGTLVDCIRLDMEEGTA